MTSADNSRDELDDAPRHRLVLIRHAKAEAMASADTERALTGDGARDAAALGRWLAARGIVPDQVVASPARRAVETWEQAARALDAATEPALDGRIYANTVDDLMSVIQSAPEPAHTLAVVGHNPTMSRLALLLDDALGDATARADLMLGLPTASVAVFELDRAWADLQANSATLVAFNAPRG